MIYGKLVSIELTLLKTMESIQTPKSANKFGLLILNEVSDEKKLVFLYGPKSKVQMVIVSPLFTVSLSVISALIHNLCE